MSKTVVLDWKQFFEGHPTVDLSNVHVYVHSAAIAVFAFMPTEAFAASGGWQAAQDAVLHIADWLCYGVVVFSGGSWMFGNRTKALELLLGSGVGYIIIRHAGDIRNFFAAI